MNNNLEILEKQFENFTNSIEKEEKIQSMIELSRFIKTLECYYLNLNKQSYWQDVHNYFLKIKFCNSIRVKTTQQLFVDFQVFKKTDDMQSIVWSILEYVDKYNLSYKDLYSNKV